MPRLLAAAVVIALASTLWWWRGANRTFTIAAVYDAISHMDEAEFSPDSPYAIRCVPTIDADDERDRLAYVRMPTGSHALWTGIETGGPVTLEIGLGVGWTLDGVEGAARFVVETRDETQDGADWVRWIDRVVHPDELDRPDRVARSSHSIGGAAKGRWSLRLSTEAIAGEARRHWPAFFAPRVASKGLEIRARDLPVRYEDVVLDLLGGLGVAKILAENPSSAVARAPIDAAKDVAVAGGPRMSIRMAAPARVRYHLHPPRDAKLAFSYGVDTDAGWKLEGDGMVFAVEVDGERVWERTLDAHRVVLERGWQAAEIRLDRFAGRSIDLDLVTEPRDDGRHDVGGFANALVVRPREVERRRSSDAPTVLFVLVDTLRADRLAVGGRNDGLTPNLDRLAAAGVAFTQARSVTSWTWPTIASLFTGLYPNAHGVHSGQGGEGYYLVDEMETLAERFQRQGYATAAFVTSLLIGASDNFDQGFETFVQTPFARARALNDRFLAWLDDTRGQARFAYLHYFDPHAPYQAPGEFAPRLDGDPRAMEETLLERLHELYRQDAVDPAVVEEWMALRRPAYDAEVRYFDHAFGELLSELESRGVLEDCVIAFTSDHGEEFYEHGWIDHGPNLFDETIKVPLLVVGFGRSALQPRVVDRPVESRNLLPTLCELADVPIGATAGLGASLLDERPVEASFGQTDHGIVRGIAGYTEKLYVVKNGWKLIHVPRTSTNEIYHLESDPRELVDRATAEPRVTERMLGELLAWHARTLAERKASRVEVDREAMRRMAELGYLTGDDG